MGIGTGDNVRIYMLLAHGLTKSGDALRYVRFHCIVIFSQLLGKGI